MPARSLSPKRPPWSPRPSGRRTAEATERGSGHKRFTDSASRLISGPTQQARLLWRLNQPVSVCVADLGSAQHPDGLREILRPASRWRIGISRRFRDVVDAPAARRQALIALGTLPSSAPGIAQFADNPMATLVASAPDTAIEVTEHLLHGVLILPEAERDTLLSALDGWFAAGGSTGVAARALFCHRNTVRYRLRRIEELTGLSLSDPRASALLLMALHAHLRR